MTESFESPFLDAAEAAQYLKLNPKTLHNLRWRGGGPPFRKHGGKAVYHIRALKDWSARREMETMEKPAPKPARKTGADHG